MKKLWIAVLLALLTLGLCVSALAASNDIAFTHKSVSVFEGEEVQLEVVTQGKCAGADVKYKSSAIKTASVDGTGLVTGHNKGRVTVTASCAVGKKTYKATITVNVLRAATDITVKESAWSLYEAGDEKIASLTPEDNELPVIVMVPGNKLTVSATVTPKDASSTKYTVTTDDSSVIRVSGTNVTALSAGSCTLTVASKSNSEVCRQYLVLVLKPVSRVTVTGDSTVFVGSEVQLEAEVSPEDADLPEVTWSSSNTRIATVDEGGMVTGVARGTVTITATAADGSKKSGSRKLTVSVAPGSVSIRQEDFILGVGGTSDLRATVSPSTVSDKGVVWTSSDPSVAMVNSSGRVTGVGIGSCIITASSRLMEDICDSVTVTVVQYVTGISCDQRSVSLYKGETCGTTWTVRPSTATIQDLTFSSSDTRIATVDEDGTVTALKAGSCTITAKATDGSKKTAKVTVTVIQSVEGVHMKASSYQLGVDGSINATAVLEPSNATNKRMSWTVDDPSIVEVTGTGVKPKLTGLRWGTTTLWGTTEDGGYTCSAEVHVGDYDEAIRLTDVYLQNNAVKLAAYNESDMSITRFYFEVELYDIYGDPIACNKSGTNILYGYYGHTLDEGDATQHGRFTFYNFTQPSEIIGQLVAHVTSYRADDGFEYKIPSDSRVDVEYTSAAYVGPIVPEYPEEDNDLLTEVTEQSGEGTASVAN